ncbi:hypothetical protein B0I37DRAFT_354352 [Chaetomium sp. MPI-CAGE-AT-0009]|nr:hypothetical protein B0I37DRAFT_354352 [Chaetomium sp. MPI-CAGE-AT-0009]
MGLTTILRGFKVPITILDRFFESNGIMQTWGFPPRYNRPPLPGADRPALDPQSAFLRTKLAATGGGGADTRIFIPNRQGQARSTHAYVAYTYIMVFGQRQIDLAVDLPDRAPPGFAGLRSEILGFAREGEDGLLQVAGMQGGEQDDPSTVLFIVVTDDREHPFSGPFMRESKPDWAFAEQEPNFTGCKMDTHLAGEPLIARSMSSIHLPSLSRTRSHRSVFQEEFESQHSLPYLHLDLGDMVSPPTPRDIHRLASDHDFVFGAHPKPKRLGWWPFIATHISIPVALVAGIIFVVVAIVYTNEVTKQMLECPEWSNYCRMADTWTIENLGTVQGIISMVYLIGMVALAYAALGLCEATVWPLLHKQSFTIKGLNAYLSTTRGSVMLLPAAVMSVKSLATGFVLASALIVTLLPPSAPPLVGHAYSPTWQQVQLESNYTSSGGIRELYAQTNPPTSVMVRVLAEYNRWATDPSAEPLPDYRDWYIDREALEERGDFTANAVRFHSSISCRPHEVTQMNRDNVWWNAFLTNMTRTNNNSTQPGGKSSSAEVWIRPQAQLTVWADDFEFVSDRRTRTTLVFAAINGTIEGGSTTALTLGNLTSVSSVACDVEIEAVDDILSVGDMPIPADTTTLSTLSSIDSLTFSPAASSKTRLNELLLWFTIAPLMTSSSVDGTQPMFTNSTTTGLPLAYTTTSSSAPNTWTTQRLTTFIRLAIGALAQATTTTTTTTTPISPSPTILLTTTPTKKLSRARTLLLLIPPLLTLTLTLAVALYTTHLHTRLGIPVMRRADVGELLKSSQTAFLREVAGTDAAKTYLPHELGG